MRREIDGAIYDSAVALECASGGLTEHIYIGPGGRFFVVVRRGKEEIELRLLSQEEAEARALRDFLADPQRDLSLMPGHECRLLAQAGEGQA